jgi:hypothetical protein
MRDQYDSRNKPRRNGREMGTWRLTSIQVVNRTPALGAVAPVFKGVDVGDMGSRGQGPEVHVIVVLAVGAERGELVGGVGFAAQQEGERHRDLRLYWSSGDEQCSQESAGARVSQGAFMVVCGVPLGIRGDVGKLLARRREGRKMASVMKVIVGSEGSRCHLGGRPRPWGPRGRSRAAYT